jgi:ParB/RepB/Spo0J family partition protein
MDKLRKRRMEEDIEMAKAVFANLENEGMINAGSSLMPIIPEGETISLIPMRKISVVSNIRKNIDKESVAELAASIKQTGLLNPIRVYCEKGKYIILCGERRFEAFKLNNETEIPGIVTQKPEDELSVIYYQAIENEQNQSITSEDRENYINSLKQAGESVKQIATRIGKSDKWVYGILETSTVREKHSDKFSQSGVDLSTRDLRDLANANDETITTVIEMVKNEPKKKTQIVEAARKISVKKPKNIINAKIDFEKEFEKSIPLVDGLKANETNMPIKDELEISSDECVECVNKFNDFKMTFDFKFVNENKNFVYNLNKEGFVDPQLIIKIDEAIITHFRSLNITKFEAP